MMAILFLFLKGISCFLFGYMVGRFYAYRLSKKHNLKTSLIKKLNRAVAQNPKPSLEN